MLKANPERTSDVYAQPALRSWYDLLATLMQQRQSGNDLHELADFAIAFGHHLNLNDRDIALLEGGAYVHDVGKLLIPIGVLEYPGKLSRQQQRVMRSHVNLGAQALQLMPALKAFEMFVLHHHERFDGSGYPKKLVGDRIPYLVRVFSLCDVWLALRSQRSYKQAYSCEESIDIMQSEAGAGLHDPELVDRLVGFVGVQ
jgi:putative two-component system response regulator